jgi:hypothetical protein
MSKNKHANNRQKKMMKSMCASRRPVADRAICSQSSVASLTSARMRRESAGGALAFLTYMASTAVNFDTLRGYEQEFVRKYAPTFEALHDWFKICDNAFPNRFSTLDREPSESDVAIALAQATRAWYKRFHGKKEMLRVVDDQMDECERVDMLELYQKQFIQYV